MEAQKLIVAVTVLALLVSCDVSITSITHTPGTEVGMWDSDFSSPTRTTPNVSISDAFS